jgi:hypothetical protein
MHICGILPGGEGLGECVRPQGHKGEHLSADKYGEFFVWEFYKEFCGPEGECVCLEDNELIECFSYGEIPKDEARKLIESLTES